MINLIDKFAKDKAGLFIVSLLSPKMAPSIERLTRDLALANGDNKVTSSQKIANGRTPLQKTGALDSAFKFEEVTPAIGREYPTANIVSDLLDGPNADELLRDLAITSRSACARSLDQRESNAYTLRT